MLRLEFNGNLMNDFEQSLASGQPISRAATGAKRRSWPRRESCTVPP